MSLELRFGETTRGSGKIYIHVSVEGADGSVPPADLAFESRNLTAGGAFLPSSTMAVPGIDGVVAIIPVLSVAQQLTVIARYADGREAARAVKTIRPLLATAESRFNTVVKNSTALAIRGCDLRYTGNPVSILVDETVFGRPGFNNVLGTITLLGCTREEVEGEVSLRIIGGNGMKADEGEWIRMGDSISRRSAVPEIFERSISFSFEIPLSCTRYLMWVTGPCVEAFQCIEPHHLAEDRKKRAEFTLPADLDQSYEEWYLRMHRATETELRAQRAHRFDYEPVFSVVVPVFRTPITFFREMAASVLDQTYPHLELILVNASPDDVVLAQEVEALAGSDARVKHVMLDENQGIWGNTALGIEQATGDFIAFLDHDDVLEPDALFCYAKGLNENPEIDLLYSDEDKLKDGHYLSPFFKPDWSPDYLMSQNYVCHMLCVRKRIIDELPEMGTLYDGAQDHFVTLFAGERARAVYHAQRVLYHWRIHEQSTAAQAGAKSYTTEAGVRAIQAHLDRMGVDATAEATLQIAPNMYRVEYHVPAETQPWVTILIPNKDMAPMLENYIELIRERSTYTNYEIVVIENN
ncbi:MAG: glycosyltransferase, partial [Atopobiaceae bacterium]|nr:glycosyltransferase [Atopobiaceae bacterium]